MPVATPVRVDASGNDIALPVAFLPDAKTGYVKSGRWTLGNAGVITTISLPDWADGFCLRANTYDVRFAVDEDPEDIGDETFAVGGIATADSWEVRTLDDGTSRTLRVVSFDQNAVVIDVEVFG